MYKLLIPTLVCCVAVSNLLSAQNISLVKDLNPGTAGSQILGDSVIVDGILFFRTAAAPNDLWRSDGTDSGTFLLKSFSNFSQLHNSGSELLFRAAPIGESGNRELWKSDGTVAGTVLVKEIVPGTAQGSGPGNLVTISGVTYFSAWSPSTGEELYRTDGTSSGTMMVKDIMPGSSSGNPRNLYAHGSMLLMLVGSVGAVELWKSDGTSGGTVYVDDVASTYNNPTVREWASIGATAYFTLNESNNNTRYSLRKTTGLPSSTITVVDIGPATSGATTSMCAHGTQLFFAGYDSTNGWEPWVSDGTPSGTNIIVDYTAGTSNTLPYRFHGFGSKVLFQSQSFGNRALVQTDGTAAGTAVLKLGNDTFEPIMERGGLLYFQGSDSTVGSELFVTNGTTGGTTVVQDLYPGFTSSLFSSHIGDGERAFLEARTAATGYELYKLNFDPTVSLAGASPQYVENASSVKLFPAATVSDLTSANLNNGSLAITITSNGTSNDRLQIENQGTSANQIGTNGSNVTWSGFIIGAATGGQGTSPLVVTLNDSCTPQACEALLRAIQYSNSSEDPSSATRTVSIEVGDGDGGMTSVQVFLSVIPINDPPTLTTISQFAGTLEDTLFSVSFSNLDSASNLADVDHSTLFFRIESVLSGNVSVNSSPVTPGATLVGAGDSIEWTPDSDDNGILQAFTVVGWDGVDASSAPVSVAVDVTPVNDAPTFSAGAGPQVQEDAGPQTFTGWASGISPGAANEGTQQLGFTVVNMTNPGIFSVAPAISASSGDLTFTAAQHASGNCVVTVELADDGGTTNGGNDTSSPVQFTISVLEVNDPPYFTSSAVTVVDEDRLYSYSVSADDVDSGPQMLSFSAASLPTWLTLTDNGNRTALLEGTPSNDDVGNHSITLELSDGVGSPVIQAFTIDVNNVNDAPVFTSAAPQTVLVGNSYDYDIQVDDVDAPSQSLTISATTLPSWMAFTDFGNRTGELTGNPTSTEIGQHQVVLAVADGVASPVTQSFTVFVAGSNTPPSFQSSPVLTATEGGAYSYDIVTVDSDIPSQPLSLIFVQGPNWLVFTDNGDGTGTLSGVPPQGSAGLLQIELSVADVFGATASQAYSVEVSTPDSGGGDNDSDDESCSTGENSSYLMLIVLALLAATRFARRVSKS